MTELNQEPGSIRKVLASDLDGTLIPLPESQKNKCALEEISRRCLQGDLQLIFCTGRHFESVLDALETEHLPQPDWIICDVGTSIHQRQGDDYPEFKDYTRHLREHTNDLSRDKLEPLFTGIDGLRLQDPAHQRPFKLSYECESEVTGFLVDKISGILKAENLPYHAHGSIDPFLHCGLIDLLPADVSKAYALEWLAAHAGYTNDEVLYAGDSGNDFHALVHGWRAVVVANASTGLGENVQQVLKQKGKADLLYTAESTATSGVLEGCLHFGWL